jgi:hypothetical protein
MKIEQRQWTQNGWRADVAHGNAARGAQFVLAFGSAGAVASPENFEQIRAEYPQASILAASTAGEIHGTRVFDETLVTTAVELEHSNIVTHHINLADAPHSREAGRMLAARFDPRDLRHVLVISDGLRVNGSELVEGLTSGLPEGVTATGGLAADGDRFQRTLVGCNAAPAEGVIAAVGFYGDRLKFGFGSLGGWDPFGPERVVTRARGNVLYELDGSSALALYKKYLGDHAAALPASALLFPLSLRTSDSDSQVVRTILAIDEDDQSMTFAGDVPEGSIVRFMKANFDRLIDGATGAARTTYEGLGAASPDLAILISCVGRKLVLKQRIEEEVEGVREILGRDTALTGFYSYGEISPFTPGARCTLHNQTMTITAISEVK